ncbi:MAG TPA: cupin domain-containing protein [Terriglobales bacterium]|nr:cupin domain-containing protein [Terriglobales bacterium]
MLNPESSSRRQERFAFSNQKNAVSTIPVLAMLESLPWSVAVPFIDTEKLQVVERLPGWYGRYFHSQNMTFAHYDFKRGASIHEHFHLQEEVYEVVEGELELTIDGVKQIARPGTVGIVPSNVHHSVKALTDGRAIIVDYPIRRDIGEKRKQAGTS